MNSRQAQFPPPSAAVSPAESLPEGTSAPSQRARRRPGAGAGLHRALHGAGRRVFCQRFDGGGQRARGEFRKQRGAVGGVGGATGRGDDLLRDGAEGGHDLRVGLPAGDDPDLREPGGGPGATAPGTASADPLAYFKLYSSDNMILNGKAACNAFTTSNTDVPQLLGLRTGALRRSERAAAQAGFQRRRNPGGDGHLSHPRSRAPRIWAWKDSVTPNIGRADRHARWTG